MKVADFQQFLREIARFAEATGASKTAVLNQIAECLDRFKSREMAEFAQFLRIADEYERTGEITEAIKLKSARKPSAPKPRKTKLPKITVSEAAQIFLGLM